MQHLKANYTLKEAATILSISTRTLRREMDDGRIRTNGKGKMRRVSAAQIDAYVLKCEQGSGWVRL